MDRLLGEHGLHEDTPAAREEFEGRMEARRMEAGDEAGLRALRRGWCLGGEDFRKQVLEQAESQLGQHRYGELRRETAEAKGQRIIAEELRRLGWQETDLVSQRRSHPAKLQIGARLRRETSLTIKEISTRLHLGTPRSASVRLHLAMRQTNQHQPSQAGCGI